MRGAGGRVFGANTRLANTLKVKLVGPEGDPIGACIEVVPRIRGSRAEPVLNFVTPGKWTDFEFPDPIPVLVHISEYPPIFLSPVEALDDGTERGGYTLDKRLLPGANSIVVRLCAGASIAGRVVDERLDIGTITADRLQPAVLKGTVELRGPWEDRASDADQLELRAWTEPARTAPFDPMFGNAPSGALLPLTLKGGKIAFEWNGALSHLPLIPRRERSAALDGDLERPSAPIVAWPHEFSPPLLLGRLLPTTPL